MNAARYASKAQGVSQKVGMTLMESVRILFTRHCLLISLGDDIRLRVD